MRLQCTSSTQKNIHYHPTTRDSQKKMEIRVLSTLNGRDYFTKGKGQDLVPEMA